MVALNTLIWAIINFLVLLSIPIAIIIVFVKFHRRLNRIQNCGKSGERAKFI